MISVIMPAKNAATTIQKAVFSVLSQTEIGELIVIDDGSTDNTVTVLSKIGDHRLKVLPSNGKGIADAINTGLKHARFDFIARCDADDFYPDNRFMWQLEFLESNRDYSAVCGAFTMADQQGIVIGDLPMKRQVSAEITDELLGGQGETHLCTWLLRTSSIRKIGGARRWFITAEDTDLQFRLAATGRVWYEPSIYYVYRILDTSITHSIANEMNEFFSTCARAFARQRVDKGDDDLQLGHPPEIPVNGGKRKFADEHITSLNEGIAWNEYRKGNYVLAISALVSALKISPLSFTLWKELQSLILKILFSLLFTR
jgi:glycosyltransferase involved in cell wall biosynthesis